MSSKKIGFCINAAAAAASVVLCLNLVGAAALADSEAHRGKAAAHHAASRHHLARHRQLVEGTAGQAYRGAAPGSAYARGASIFRGPGYVFVPGEGILGEDCNMPTSTCPNYERDIQ